MIVSLLTIGLLFLPSTNAFWRLPCAKPVLSARVDPIVSPGKASGHAHTIAGSSAIGFDTTFNDLTSSNCTTCKVNDDKSGYWIPELYYQYPNESFKAVDHGGMVVYYLQRSGSNETVQPFPDGLRMLTGDSNVRNNTGSDASKAISWLCLDYSKPGQPQTPGFTSSNCPDGLRAQVFFPGCWDGVNIDSPNHQSHMAYPSGIDNGECPSSHPVHLVSIFYEVWFSVSPFIGQGGRIVLSNGDSTGYGLHGDFMDGWNKDVLGRAIQSCTDGSGVIENCGVFANENRFVSDAVMNSCTAPNPLPSEDFQGPMPHLPGCVAVTDGPAPASPAKLDPGCVSGSGSGTPIPASGLTSPQNTSSSSIPAAASSPASLPPSTTPASGDVSVPSSSSSPPASSSPATPPPANTPALGNGDISVPSSSSSMPASTSPATPPPANTPATPLNPTTSSTPAPANPPDGSSQPPEGDGNDGQNPSPNSASGGPSSTSPGVAAPPPTQTTSTTLPSSTQSTPASPSSSSSAGNHTEHHPGHKHHGNYSQPQQQQDDGEHNGGYCTGAPPAPKKRAAKKRTGDTRRPMRRRHHARRAAYEDSFMYL